ncbi:hypothetical protein ABZY05_40410 [Streptomyces canus]|uniref:hypothetical protein n=1 Tax=Streptomyces canus TaxID=58343 RepID=UPI0033A5D40A
MKPMNRIEPDLLRAVAAQSGGEVQRQLWFALRVLVRRPSARGARSSDPSAEAVLGALEAQPTDLRAAVALSESLEARADDDADFAAALHRWLAEASDGDVPNIAVHNVVNGGVFHGPVIQGRDMSNILFSASPDEGR